MFPIVNHPDLKQIPWSIIAPHEAQARLNHAGKTLDVLARQGGLMPEEALAVIEGRPWERMGWTEANQKLVDYVAGATAPPEPLTPSVPHPAREVVQQAILVARNTRDSVTPVRYGLNKLIVMLERVEGML